MTANQIAYAKHREESRHNLVSERHEHQDVKSRRLTAEAAGRNALANSMNAETNARNATTNWWAAQEQGRHNLETERISQYSADATRAFQLQQGEALLRQAAVSERQASVSEANSQSMAKQAEAAVRQAAIAAQNATTRENELAASIRANQRQVALGYAQLSENRRHNQAYESEISRSNRVSEINTRTSIENQRLYNEAMARSAARNATTNRINASTNRRQAAVSERNATVNERNVELGKLKAANQYVSDLARTFVIGGLR